MSENITSEKKGKKEKQTDNQKYRNYSHKSAIKSLIPEDFKISSRGLDIINDLVSYFFVELKKNCFQLIRFIHAKKLTATTVKHALPLFYFNQEINGRNQTFEIIKEIDDVLAKWNEDATNKSAEENDISIMPSRIETQLKENMEAFQLSKNGIKAVTIAVNYFASILIAKVVTITKKYGKTIITPHHIKLALVKDLALSYLFPNTAIMFGGIDDEYERTLAASKKILVSAKSKTIAKAKTVASPKTKTASPKPKAKQTSPKPKTKTAPPKPKAKPTSPKPKAKPAAATAPKKSKRNSFTIEHGEHTLDVYEVDGKRFLTRGNKELSPPYWPDKCGKGMTRKPTRTGNCVESTKKSKKVSSPKITKKTAKSPKAVVPIPKKVVSLDTKFRDLKDLKRNTLNAFKANDPKSPELLFELASLGAKIGILINQKCAQKMTNERFDKLLNVYKYLQNLETFITRTANNIIEDENANEEERELSENAIQEITDVMMGLKINMKRADYECNKYQMSKSTPESPAVALAKEAAAAAKASAIAAAKAAAAAEEEASESSSDTVSSQSSPSSPSSPRKSPRKSPLQGMIPRQFRK